MRYALILFGLMFVTAFGAISLVESYTPANAGVGAADDAPDDDDQYDQCHDDGDDGENPGVVDDPDQEENDAYLPGGEQGDTEEMDPFEEEDDEGKCRVILPDTQSPSPTPCPSIAITGGGPTSECCPDPDPGQQAEQFTCVCPDSAGGDVSAEFTCVCLEGTQDGNGCLCQLGGVPDCCQYFGGCGTAALSADVDCDGEVTPGDAYESLAVLSGFETSTGDGCGGGDADCSNAVDAKDTLAILSVVAGLEEPAVC